MACGYGFDKRLGSVYLERQGESLPLWRVLAEGFWVSCSFDVIKDPRSSARLLRQDCQDLQFLHEKKFFFDRKKCRFHLVGFATSGSVYAPVEAELKEEHLQVSSFSSS